jgi:3-oxo-5-alpha-steroid 4-dehydrogenase 1
MNFSFDSFLYLWLAIAVLTFASLFFISAPYGRHNRKGWGAQVNNKWGWIIMELASPFALSYFFFSTPNEKNSAVWVFYLLWIFHYFYRSLIFPFKLNSKGKTIPLSIVLMAIFFNSVNGFTNGFYFGNFAADYSTYSFLSPQFILGFAVFILGFYIHFKSDNILINLRKNNSGYNIPNSFLFKKVASPNYFGEILEWFGFAIMTNALSAWCFLAWTIANLAPRALANYKWYKNKFPDYPKDRKILIPGII